MRVTPFTANVIMHTEGSLGVCCIATAIVHAQHLAAIFLLMLSGALFLRGAVKVYGALALYHLTQSMNEGEDT